MSKPRSRSKSKDRFKTKDGANTKSTNPFYRDPCIEYRKDRNYHNRNIERSDRPPWTFDKHRRFADFTNSPPKHHFQNFYSTGQNNYTNSNNSKFKNKNYNKSHYYANKKNKCRKTRWDSPHESRITENTPTDKNSNSTSLNNNSSSSSTINYTKNNFENEPSIVHGNQPNSINNSNPTSSLDKVFDKRDKNSEINKNCIVKNNNNRNNNSNAVNTNLDSENLKVTSTTDISEPHIGELSNKELNSHYKSNFTRNFQNSGYNKYSKNKYRNNDKKTEKSQTASCSFNQDKNKLKGNQNSVNETEVENKDTNSNKKTIETENCNEKTVQLKRNLKILNISRSKNLKIVKPKLVPRKKNSCSTLQKKKWINSKVFPSNKNQVENGKADQNSKETQNHINSLLKDFITDEPIVSESSEPNANNITTEKAPKIFLVPLNNLLKESILSEINSGNLFPDNILDSAKQDLTEKLVNKVAKMDKIGIKNIINNPATKFDEALKQKARQHLREEIRKELRALQYEQNNVDSRNILDQTFESNPLYNHEAISQAVLEQIRRKFGIDFLLEATSNESHANNNFLETALINSTTNLNMDQESDLVNNNSNIKSTRDISFVADSTSNLNTNEEIIPFITPINEDLNTINSCESSVNTEIVSTNTSPNTQRRNSFKANNSSLSESSDLNINFSENTLESAKLESKNCSRINEQPIIMKKEFIKLSPKSMQEKLKLLPDRPSTSKITHRNKVKSSPLKKPSKIGFKENEILIIDSSSSSSNDDSSSSESSSESDSNSSSNSSSSNSERNKKITNRKKPHKKRLEAAVINRFRRLVLPNLSKYLQKKFEERYSKSSNNSTINFIYDICLSKIFKNSSLTQSAKKILKTNLKSLKQQEFLQFLFDNMKDLFLLSSQDKHTNEVLGSPSSKFMENFSASKIIPEINTETSNIVASKTNQLESTSLSICDNDKNDNDSVNNSKDFCIPQKDSPNKPTIQFDKKSLNLIANELKNFSEQIKVLMTEKQINSQSSENLPLSSSNVDEMKEKNSSSASCENLVHIEEKSENEFSTLNSNRISSIKNNSIIENQTSNNFDDSNTATTLENFNLTICNNVKENQDNTIDDNGINNENNNIEEAFSNENVDKAKISNSVNATSTKISIKQENCGNRNDSVLQKEEDLLNENKEHGNNEQIIKKYDEKELSSTTNEDNLDNRAENSENNSNHLRENHENNFGDECEKNEYQKVTKDLLIATSSPLQHFMELSEPENDSTKYNNDQNIPSDNELQRKNDYISSRLWKSPGEKKCIEFSSEETTDNALTPEIKNDKNENIKDSKSNSNTNSETPDTSTTTTSLDFTNSNNLRENSKNPSLVCTNETESVAENTFEETVVNNLKEIDLKLLELHKRKMFVEEMILKLQKDKMEIDFASMQLQNEKFLIMNATVTKSNICNSQKNPLLTFQTYLNSTNNMMNEPLSASDYISNMFANNQKSIPVTPTTKRKRPDSQSSSTSGSSPTKKMCTRRRLSISGDNDGSETDENSKKASTSNTIKGTHSETYKSPERNEKHKVKSKSETSTTKKKSTVKEKQSDNKGTNKSKKNNTSIETNNFNDDEEEIELSRELLKESKTCKNGPFLGTKLMITQIKVFEKFVIASSQDGNIYKYCWKTKELLGKFSKHTESVTQIHIDKNNCVYSISLDGFMRKTSIEKFGLEMLAVNLEEPLQSIDVAWHTVFVGTKWGNVFSYDLLESKISDLFEYSANNTIVGVIATKLSTNQNLKILIVTSKSNQIEIVNASNGHSIKIIETSQNPKIFSTLSNEGILYYCSTKNEINKFNIKTNCKLAAITCATKESIIFIKLIKKVLLFVGCNDGSIYVINKRTGKEIHKYKLCENLITAIDFFGEKVIFASKDNRMVMEDLPSCISSYKHY